MRRPAMFRPSSRWNQRRSPSRCHSIRTAGNAGRGPGAHGWGVAMSTDTALALGAQSLYRDANRGQTESQDSGRRFLTALPGPLRLDARALFWCGVGLIVIGFAWGKFLPDLVVNFGVPLYQNLAFRLLVDVISTSTMLGMTLVAVALGVRSLPRDDDRDRALSGD